MTRRKTTEEKKSFYNSHDISQILEETIAQFDFEHVYWLNDEDYAKAVGQLKLQFGTMLEPLRMYGQKEYVSQVLKEAVKLCEDFGLRVRGIDKTISLEIIRRKALMNWSNTEEKKE